MVQGRHHRGDRVVVLPALEGDGPLAGSGHEQLGLQHLGRFSAPAQPVQAGRREDDRVAASLAQLADPRVDVAAQVLEHEVGPQRGDLGPPPQARRPHARTGGQLVELEAGAGEEGVAGIGALQHRAEAQAGGQGGRHVLEVVDRQVDLARQHGLLDLLEKGSLAAHRFEAAVLDPVTGRSDQVDRGLVAEAGQPALDVLGLPPRQRAPA